MGKLIYVFHYFAGTVCVFYCLAQFALIERLARVTFNKCNHISYLIGKIGDILFGAFLGHIQNEQVFVKQICQILHDRNSARAGAGGGDQKIRPGHNSLAGGPHD